jgi:hypothetical protein
MSKPLLEIVGQIHQIAHQFPNLRYRILNGPSVMYVRDPRPRTRPSVSGFTFLGMFAEPLSVALFNKRTHWKFPPLLRAGTQPRKLSRIHAEGARHLELPGIKPADRLRILPSLFVVLPLLLRHRERVMRRPSGRKPILTFGEAPQYLGRQIRLLRVASKNQVWGAQGLLTPVVTGEGGPDRKHRRSDYHIMINHASLARPEGNTNSMNRPATMPVPNG